VRWTVWLGRAGLLLGGLVAGVVLADCAAGRVQPHGAADLLFNAPDNAPQGIYVNDPDLVFVPTPGFSGTMRSLGYAVPLRFNEHSLRGPEVGAKSGTRWLAVGDSFTLSAQVTEEETFAGRLAAKRGWEVWNAGADGYSTWQAARRYASLDEELDLDGVLLTFFLGNDFQDNQRFPMELQRAANREAGQPIHGKPIPWTTRFLMRHSYLYGQWLIRGRVAAMASPDSHERQRWQGELMPFTRHGTGRIQALLRDTEGALQELAQTAKRNGDPVVVAIAPPAFVIDTERVGPTFELVGLDPSEADLHAPGRTVRELVERAGLTACDLVAPLEAARGDEPLYFTYDGHWTARGHEVVASALDACLSEL